jgi:hypothetical protein
VTVTLREVFESPTVAGLAAVIDRAARDEAMDGHLVEALEELELMSDAEVRSLLDAGGAEEA